MAARKQRWQEWNVAEIQGLYGPFTFTERLLQKIWARGEFDADRAVTEDGEPLRVMHPGRWNLLGGPDFRDARLQLGARTVTGDVELHLHAGDWTAHAHAHDHAYDQVVLHVVLFPPSPGEQARRADGCPLPTLVLLPRLWHDLEEYAAEDAIETLARRADWRTAEELARLPPGEATALLRVHGESRWRQKVQFARRRVERLGWAGACHYTALEILGYRFNRAAMLRIATRWELGRWCEDGMDPEVVFGSEAAWSLQGIRPANHPRVRLRQYAAWVRSHPDWPEALAQLDAELPLHAIVCGEATTAVRTKHDLPEWRERFAARIAAGVIRGTRLDNLVCDGFLPLLTARSDKNRAGSWFHWYAGDLPPRLKTALRSLGIFGGGQPACHGFAQGLLGWMLAREISAVGGAGGDSPASVGA